MGPAPVSAASALPPEDPTPARRPGVGTVIRHLLGVGLMIAGLWATIELFLHRSAGQQIDETALAEVSNRLQRYTAQSSSLLNALPAISAGLAVAGILIVLFRRHRFAPALVGVLVAVGANGSAQLLKSTLVKPNLGIQDAVLNSLPSGHTTFAMAAGSALFLAAPRRWRPGLAILMCAFAVVMGVATVINGWHRPADVVAAIFLVSASVVLVLMSLPLLIPWNVVGTIWQIFGRVDIGLLGYTLDALGINYNYTQNPIHAWATVIVMDVWHWTPFCFLLFLAGLAA